MSVTEKVQSWLNSNIDEDTKASIKHMMENDSKELEESFYQDLEFGTGGLRGIMGVGSNRMNKYTIGMATQGLANYLKKNFSSKDISVAIAHDSRNNSRFFSETTAGVFAANGIKVYLFEELRPTPQLSFAIRHLGCKSGVVVTASHNPKEYNGYKAYWEDGAQVIAPHDKNIIEEVQKIKSIDDIQFNGNSELIVSVGKELDDAYLKVLKSFSVSPEVNQKQKDLSIVFSSIHGTGITLVPEILKAYGFENVHIVEEQKVPDGNFPTVVYPNPEEAEALTLALNKAKGVNADLVMATDPDSDRVGIAVKNLEGEFQLLNGNQTGALIFNYILKCKKEKGQLQSNNFTVNTIVTSDLLNDISEGYGVDAHDTLTGFKHIAALIKSKEGIAKYLVGGEESYGYLIGDEVRDKDAIASCAIIAELTAYAKEHGKSVFEELIDIYVEFDFYKEKLISLTKKGMDGAQQIKDMMEGYRKNPPTTIAGSDVVELLDYQSGESKNLKTSLVSSIDFPSSNVLQFVTEDGSKISARPSGTEPKIKFYFSVKEKLERKEDYDAVNQKLDNKIDAIIEGLDLKS
ncbi:MAG: phospho-sugar mutase [Bacteroidota bacterium]